MRLSDILSKPPTKDYVQIDTFLLNKAGKTGQKVDIAVGKIALNYFCAVCNDARTFFSGEKLTCIFVNKNLISIDCVLSCVCGTTIPIWFLVESENEIIGQVPKVKILKRSIQFSEKVHGSHTRYGEFNLLLDKAIQAYAEGFGAGSIVYLRKVFEKVIIQTANAVQIEYQKYENGNPKNFSELLKKVDERCSIIPREFSEDGYKLFRELSNVIHGEYDENVGLKNFEALHRLVIGVLDNLISHEEIINAMDSLGWTYEGEENNE